jgi:hypothetical protein
MSSAEVRRELCTVYSPNVMSEGNARQWYTMFKMCGRKNVHDEGRNSRPSVVSDDFVQSVDQQNCERLRFTVSELSCELSQISRYVVYEIITASVSYHKFCAGWVPKMLRRTHKKERICRI